MAVFYVSLSKTRKEDPIMRLLALAAAATLALSGTALAAQQQHHHHQAHAATATPVADGAIPADVLSTHDLYVRNVREAGYDHQVK
jgi:prophage DNA circulation protein